MIALTNDADKPVIHIFRKNQKFINSWISYFRKTTWPNIWFAVYVQDYFRVLWD
jgi:hypothetical protein